MLDYIIKVLLFQTLFLAVYDLFLKRETFFQWNRVYLMATSLLAYVIPNIRIHKVQEFIPQEYVVMLPEVILNPAAVIEQQFDWWTVFYDGLTVLFWIGVAFTSLLFALRLFKIIRLIYSNKKEQRSNYFLVLLEDNKAFSFFNYIFLGNHIAKRRKKQVIEHELVHVKQYHSLDLLFFELQKIVFWFNPYSYLYQARISELHEFIADSKAVKTEDKVTYFNNLLAETFSVQNISFINPFLKSSLIKKRIVMLNKDKSKQLLKFKYVLLIPVLAAMLMYISCEKSEQIIESKPTKEFLNQKSEDEKFIDERIDKLFKELSESKNLNDEDYKKVKEIKEKLYLYLLQKREEKTIKISDKEQLLSQHLSANELAKGVPFAVIEKSPIFPGCEDAEDLKKCLQESIQKYLGEKFNTNLAKTLGLTPGKKRVISVFKIDKKGTVVDVKSRGPHADLEKEAIRVVSSLPKMIPGEQRGEKVAVKYTLPITLYVE